MNLFRAVAVSQMIENHFDHLDVGVVNPTSVAPDAENSAGLRLVANRNSARSPRFAAVRP